MCQEGHCILLIVAGTLTRHLRITPIGSEGLYQSGESEKVLRVVYGVVTPTVLR